MSTQAVHRAAPAARASTVTIPRRHAVAVHGHHRAQPGQALLVEQRLERVLEPGAQAAVAVIAGHHRGDVALAALGLGHALHGLAGDHADQAPALVHHREPGPAVAQEELAPRRGRAWPPGHGDRLGVHHVGHRRCVDAVGEVGLAGRRAGGLGEEEADEGEPDAADTQASVRPPAAARRPRSSASRSRARAGRRSGWRGCGRR